MPKKTKQTKATINPKVVSKQNDKLFVRCRSVFAGEASERIVGGHQVYRTRLYTWENEQS